MRGEYKYERREINTLYVVNRLIERELKVDVVGNLATELEILAHRMVEVLYLVLLNGVIVMGLCRRDCLNRD